MELTPRIEKAINLATKLHAGQSRKDDALMPYISHPFAVAWIIANYTTDEDVVIAGLLHDILEDAAGFTDSQLTAAFGQRVTDLVKSVSEKKDPNVSSDKKASWQERKEVYLHNLLSASDETLLISGADKLHNLRSLILAHDIHGAKLWDLFNSPADKKLWFYEEVAKVIRQRLNNQLADELDVALNNIKQLVDAS